MASRGKIQPRANRLSGYGILGTLPLQHANDLFGRAPFAPLRGLPGDGSQMGGEDDVIQPEQGVIRARRLIFHHIECGPGDSAPAEEPAQGLFVDDAAAFLGADNLEIVSFAVKAAYTFPSRLAAASGGGDALKIRAKTGGFASYLFR